MQTERFVRGGGGAVQARLSLLYSTPAPSAELQHPEAWPASTYGYLRGVSLKIVSANNLFVIRY